MKKYVKLAWQFFKFGIVGAANTLVSMAVYYVLIGIGVYYIIAHTAGYIVGTLNAYYWNSKYVFRKQTGEVRSGTKSLLKSFVSYGGTFLLSTVLLYFWVDMIGISDRIAPIINLFITTPLNFVLNKLWAFRAEDSGAEGDIQDDC